MHLYLQAGAVPGVNEAFDRAAHMLKKQSRTSIPEPVRDAVFGEKIRCRDGSEVGGKFFRIPLRRPIGDTPEGREWGSFNRFILFKTQFASGPVESNDLSGIQQKVPSFIRCGERKFNVLSGIKVIRGNGELNLHADLLNEFLRTHKRKLPRHVQDK